MLFHAHEFFAFFLPAVWVGAYLLRQRRTALILWFVLSSFIFYGWSAPADVFLLIASITANYGIAVTLSRRKSPQVQRLILSLGILGNLALLGFYKYSPLALSTWYAFVGVPFELSAIVLPLAISFFTFQQIAFLVDCSREDHPLPTFRNYILFVSFFPQLVAGPIVRHHQFLPQLESNRFCGFRHRDLMMGLAFFAIGLFKKSVFADRIEPMTSYTFQLAESGASIATGLAWKSVIGFFVQMYFDFSGYADMAIGLGLLFGIQLPINFASPLRSQNLREFWRRWHITVCSFFRDYLYIPLGGNRRGTLGTILVVLVTMTAVGVWHGGTWNFVLFGLVHGIGLTLYTVWERTALRKNFIKILPHSVSKLIAITINVVFITGVTAPLFCCKTLEGAGQLYSALFTFSNFSFSSAGISGIQLIEGFALFALVGLFPNSQQWLGYKPSYQEKVPSDSTIWSFSKAFENKLHWRPSRAWATLSAALCVIGILSLNEVKRFIYFEF